MRNLLLFIIKHRHWLLFAVLEVASMVLLMGYNSYQRSVWLTSANAVAGKIYEWHSTIDAFFRLAEANDSLTARNIMLEQEVNRLTTLYTQATHDTTAAERSTLALLDGYEMVEARVVGNTLPSPLGMLTIDRGRDSGIESDMGVAAGDGVVGIVFQASSHYAVVMPLLNVHSRISGRIRGSGYFGHVTWDGRDPAIVHMEDVPRHATFSIGDQVETSGYSAIFPEGILVGTITKIDDADDGVSYRLTVRTGTDFSNLRNVRVIRNKDFGERRRLLEASQDSLKSRRRT